MNKERKNELIIKYNLRQADAFDMQELEQLIEAGEIDLKDLADISLLDKQLSNMDSPSPSIDLDGRFYDMLAREKKTHEVVNGWKNFFSWPVFAPKLALASIAMILGFIGGYMLKSPNKTDEVQVLSKEVSNLKEMMMLSLLEKESATDRLKAVNLTESMDDVSSKVTDALLQTLNTDNNVNVRLAALEALLPYAKESNVREALIRSIAKQNSPLLQVALAEVMVALQVKSSVHELEKVMLNKMTPKDVKNKIKQSIDVLT